MYTIRYIQYVLLVPYTVSNARDADTRDTD